MYDENIKLLANAVILQACRDYVIDSRSIEHFINSEWFVLLSRGACNPQALIKRLREGVNIETIFYNT